MKAEVVVCDRCTNEAGEKSVLVLENRDQVPLRLGRWDLCSACVYDLRAFLEMGGGRP